MSLISSSELRATDEELRRHQAHHFERARSFEGSGALLKVRGRTLSKVLSHAAGHQILHHLDLQQELLWRGQSDPLGQSARSHLRHGLPDQRPVRGRMQSLRDRGGTHQHRWTSALRDGRAQCYLIIYIYIFASSLTC